jgi:hypothetical protein
VDTTIGGREINTERLWRSIRRGPFPFILTLFPAVEYIDLEYRSFAGKDYETRGGEFCQQYTLTA